MARTGNEAGTAHASSTTALGRRIRMRALTPQELPAHPDLAAQQDGAAPALADFVAETLAEAETFMAGYVPPHFGVKSTAMPSPPSAAPVELRAHRLDATALGGGPESWFARTSVHRNAAADGTASWAEFDHGLRVDHSAHEMAYTPGVRDAHHVLRWDVPRAAGASEGESESGGGRVGAWDDVVLTVTEMRHHIPPPLADRVFPVLVLTARRATPPPEFVVVQVPVDTRAVPGAKYPGTNVVTGMYCSVERGQLIDAGDNVKWQMATASDAKGVLPMWVQKLGVPGAIVKDVGLFVGWTARERTKAAQT